VEALEVGGLAAEAGPVIDDLEMDLARAMVDQRHARLPEPDGVLTNLDRCRSRTILRTTRRLPGPPPPRNPAAFPRTATAARPSRTNRGTPDRAPPPRAACGIARGPGCCRDRTRCRGWRDRRAGTNTPCGTRLRSPRP